jgi:hypothetical protein
MVIFNSLNDEVDWFQKPEIHQKNLSYGKK